MTIVAKLGSRAARITPGDRLGLALGVAVIVHAIIILGVGFGSEPNRIAPALDVVLVRTPAHEAPRDAEYLAQAGSRASGTATSRSRPGSPFSDQALSGHPTRMRTARAAQPENPEHNLLVQRRADYQVPDALRQLPEAMNAGESSANLDSQIARLTSELAADARHYAKRSRVHFLQSVSARSAVEAPYVKTWIDRVESVGNAHYPGEARRRELSGRVILHVLLNSKGDVVKAFIGSPSGQPVLDTAAMRIVQLAAPFKPFSGDMNKTYDRLMITRTWIFASDGRLSTR